MTKNKNNLVATGLRTMVGIGLMGATAGMVNQLPAGTAKNIAGVVPGLQATALVANNVKLVKTSFGKGSNNLKHKHKNSLWPKIHG